MPRKKQPRNIPRSRELRKNLSLPEVLLWNELRQQSDVKFRRQHSLGDYFLDFYCAKAKICIEVDGIAHDMDDRPERDEERDRLIGAEGIEVVRIAAREILADPNAVAESLVNYCRR